jgi:hypothetical protein
MDGNSNDAGEEYKCWERYNTFEMHEKATRRGTLLNRA